MAEGKVQPGDDFYPPPAPIWNNMIDAGRAWADSRLNGGSPNPIRPRETDIIKAKNTSGSARRLGEILRLSGKAIETVTDENKWLLGVEPTDDGYFGILKEPAASNGLASLQVSGCCMALVNVADADHRRATSADGEYVLQSGDDGPIEILFAPDGTGEKTCVVRFSSVGSGGTPTILFEIIRVLRGFGLNCNAMECEVINISCGDNSVTIGDIVTVYDEIGCIFNAPEHLLAGLRGYAIKMGNPSYASDDPLVFEPGTEDIAKPTGNCRWCAQNTCCVEEE
jgi:hypothetical protein